MKRRALLASLTLLGAARARALEEGAADPAKPACYASGDLIDGATFVLDAERRPVRLLDLAGTGTRILYLVILGGASGDKEPGLWCGDTRSDLAIHGAMLRRFATKGVRFVAVAAPPVYSEARRGYEAGVFLTTDESSAGHAAAVEGFIARTEALRANGSLPFGEVFYDPRFRLLDNASRFPHVAAYGSVHAWQGRFKACGDDQRHGTPTLWLLGPDGRVLHEPFYGNVYEPPDEKIRYREADVASAIEAILVKASGSAAR